MDVNRWINTQLKTPRVSEQRGFGVCTPDLTHQSKYFYWGQHGPALPPKTDTHTHTPVYHLLIASSKLNMSLLLKRNKTFSCCIVMDKPF